MSSTRQSRSQLAWRESPQLEVIIEVPRGSFLKRGYTEKIDFISPFPCPFNYGAVSNYVGLDNDLLDALVLGSRLPRGTRVKVKALGAVGLTDRAMYGDKLVCGHRPPRRSQRRVVLLFFNFYAFCKRLLNLYRGRRGRTACEGWGEARAAISRATLRDETWQGPTIPF